MESNSNNNITRNEYCHGQERIHSRIDEIAQTTHEIKVYAQMMKESVDRMHDTVYGKSTDNGLTSRLTVLFERVSLHTKLVVALMLSLLAVAVKSIWK